MREERRGEGAITHNLTEAEVVLPTYLIWVVMGHESGKKACEPEELKGSVSQFTTSAVS